MGVVAHMGHVLTHIGTANDAVACSSRYHGALFFTLSYHTYLQQMGSDLVSGLTVKAVHQGLMVMTSACFPW